MDPDSDAFERLLAVWNGASTEALRSIISETYRGHMLHVAAGERDGASYAGVILDYRDRNPSAHFELVERLVAGDRVVSRLRATRNEPTLGPETANGINISRV